MAPEVKVRAMASGSATPLASSTISSSSSFWPSTAVTAPTTTPGGGNWLGTKGRTETILLARYLLPEDERAPIVTRVVQT